MPSSTSSSERHAPPGNWRTIWVVALVIAISTTWCSERVLRDHGQRPSVVDDPVRWALARRSIDDDARAVALVGTSRMQLAFARDTFAQLLPDRRPVQLAINGVPAISILADLAADERFRGFAVVDMDEWDIAWGDPADMARPYLERAGSLWRAPGAVANRVLSTVPQEHLASLAIGGRALLAAIGRGKSPPATWVATDRHRVGRGDYSLASAAALRAKARKRYTNFEAPSLEPAAWVERALAIEPYVRAIRARGGDVIVLRLPISGRLAELFEQHYPRRLYWDAFAARSTARVLHYEDLPGMSDVQCPDEMHVDQRDQATFTRALVAAMRRFVVDP